MNSFSPIKPQKPTGHFKQAAEARRHALFLLDALEHYNKLRSKSLKKGSLSLICYYGSMADRMEFLIERNIRDLSKQTGIGITEQPSPQDYYKTRRRELTAMYVATSFSCVLASYLYTTIEESRLIQRILSPKGSKPVL